MDNVPSVSSTQPTPELQHHQDLWTPNLSKSNMIVSSVAKAITTYIRPRDSHKLSAAPGKEKVYNCKLCAYSSRFQNGLDYHMKKRHGEGEKFVCRDCGYTCYLKQNLTQHIRQHTGEKPFACEFCDNFCSASKSGLRYHVRTKHDQKSLISCSICGYKAYNTHILTQHLRKHSGLKPFTCSLCGSTFSTKTSLRLHMKSKHVEDINSPFSKTSQIENTVVSVHNSSNLPCAPNLATMSNLLSISNLPNASNLPSISNKSGPLLKIDADILYRNEDVHPT